MWDLARAWWQTGPSGQVAASLVALDALAFLVLGAGLFWNDLTRHRLPRRLSRRLYPVLGVGLLLGALLAGEPQRVASGLFGACLAWAVLAVSRRLSQGSVGRGDLFLAPVLGWTCGFLSVLHAAAQLAMTFFGAGIWGTTLLVTGRAQKSTHLPLGPWLLVTTVAACVLLPSGVA